MSNSRALFIGVLCVVMAGGSCSASNTSPDLAKTHAISLIDVTSVPAFVSDDERGKSLWDTTKQVYTLRQFQPAWLARDTVGADADAALQVLESASAEGLHPEDFAVSNLRRLRDGLNASSSPVARNEFDTRLTFALVRYVGELCYGRIDARAINADWPAADPSCDVPEIVNNAVDERTVENLANELSPKIPEYQGLKSSLERYRDIAQQGGWQPEESEIARTLELMGDLAPGGVGAAPSRKNVKEALQRFQERHGLKPDGQPGKKTLDALKVPVTQRIEQIEINMDRMRWIARRLESRHIRVNIPGFQLSVVDAGHVPLQMRAIVGSQENPTPVLDGMLQYLVFSPYWNIPLSIATKELLPEIQKNPDYLKRENIEVVRVSKGKVDVLDPSKIKWDKESDLSGYQLRQKPGATNALGLVKFIFPNPQNIYLHDTPSGNLFDRLTRTLSHGCVRVEHPAELARYLLQDQPEWTLELIEEAMHAEEEKRVPLKTHLPVHLVYWTAWADAEGKLHFREDVYGYDQKHRELTTPTNVLPAAHAADIDVDKVGAGIVTDSSSFHRQRGFSK